MPLLFSPLTIKDITFKNRIVVSPMCQYSAEDGFANDWHLVHLGSRAVGGAALIIQEATAISPEGRISPGDLGLWKDEHISKLHQITTFIQQQGSVAGIQLAHAGRKASHATPWQGGKEIKQVDGGWQTVAPSAIPFIPSEDTPAELTKDGIEKVKADFAVAAKRSLAAGYQVVEIHAAHGYLIHEFLSPLSNRRTDEYGGSFDNRIRFLLGVVTAIQTEWPGNLPLFVRISATDWVEDGWTVEDSVKLSAILRKKGVDLIDCSTGGNATGVKIPLVPGYQVRFAEQVKKEADILTGAVGLITQPEQAEEIIASGKADLVLFAREELRNPYFPFTAALQLGADITWPVQYERAKPR